MTLFEQIVSEVITEDVGIGKVNDAIERTYEVKINYQSEHDNASGERIIQPVAYGLSKKGNPVIRAYQPYGDTKTKTPAWKFFLLSGIKSWKPLFKRSFRVPAEGFNPTDDKTMSTVYKISKFWDSHLKQHNKPSTTGPVKKNDVNKDTHISVQDHPQVKNLDKLRKQLDNPTFISDIIKNNSFNTDNKINSDNSQLTSNSGPVQKVEYKTQSEKDIESRREQMNKNQKVSQDVLDQWKKEQEKRLNKKDYGSK